MWLKIYCLNMLSGGVYEMKGSLIRPTLLLLPFVLIVGSIANAQEVAKVNAATTKTANANVPVFADYRGEDRHGGRRGAFQTQRHQEG